MEITTQQDPNPCKHRKQYPSATQWPDAAALEHFDECLTPERRAEVFAATRKYADVGTQCTYYRHAQRIQATLDNAATLQQVVRTDQAYIESLTSQLRELVADLPGWDDDGLKDRLVAILETTRAQSAEKLTTGPATG